MDKKIEISFKQVFVIGILLVLIVASVAFATVTTRLGSAIIGRFDYVEVAASDLENDLVCPTNEIPFPFEPIPGMEKTFTQGGLVANEVIVSFSGEFKQINNPGATVVLLIDGVLQPGVGQVGIRQSVDLDTIDSSNLTWNFITAPLSPGSHTVTLQWKGSGGGSSCLKSRTMIIHHR